MSNKVTTPYPLFSDIDGSPLNAGFLFLGVNGQDAEQNPINVYWNEEKTELAAQPLRTRNGLIVRDELPAKIFIEEVSCSVTIKNCNGTPVQLVSSFDPPSSAKGVKAQIDAETSRATAAETSLGNQITNVNTTLGASISSEVTRATNAEAALQGQISSIGVGNKAYLTYAAMDADKANIPNNSKVTVTNDTTSSNNGDWQFSTTGGGTFTKSIFDPLTQSKAYTDSCLPIVLKENLYTGTNVADFNVNPSDGSLRQVTGTALSIFAIRAGKTYAVKAADVRTAYLIVSTSPTNTYTNNKAQTLVTLSNTADPNIKTFTVPSNSPDLYAFINVLWPAFTFDIRSSLIVQEGSTIENAVTTIRNVQVKDTTARNSIRALEDKNLVSANDIIKTVNFYSTSNDTPNLYLASDTALMTTLSGTALGRWAVEAGKTYTVKSSKFLATAIVGLSPDSTATSGKSTTRVLLTDTADPLVKTFTVPTGSTAKFAFFTVLLPSQNYDVRTTLVVNAGVAKIVDDINGAAITDAIAQAKIKILEENQAGNTYVSILKGKKWAMIGDSLTEANGHASFHYYDYVSNAVGGMTLYNFGISSTGYGDRWATIASQIINAGYDPDYIIPWLGTNDFRAIARPLGTFGDTTNATIAGAIYQSFTRLIDAFPTKKIGVVTPLPRGGSVGPNWGENAAPNEYGCTLKDIVDMIIKHCNHFSIPYMDLYREGGLFSYDPDAATALVPDGIHPNNAGHTLLGQKWLKFMESL